MAYHGLGAVADYRHMPAAVTHELGVAMADAADAIQVIPCAPNVQTAHHYADWAIGVVFNQMKRLHATPDLQLAVIQAYQVWQSAWEGSGDQRGLAQLAKAGCLFGTLARNLGGHTH